MVSYADICFFSLPLLRKTDVKIRKQTEKRETKRKQETVFYVFLRVSLANIGKFKLSLKALILSAFTFICFLVFSNAFCRTKIFKYIYFLYTHFSIGSDRYGKRHIQICLRITNTCGIDNPLRSGLVIYNAFQYRLR